MKNALKLCLLLLLLCLNCKVYSYSMGDWSTETKNGTAFNDPGGGLTIALSNGDKYKNIKKWYFYKNHIIGTSIQFVGTYDERLTCYFIMNELNNQVLAFDEEDAWYKYRSEHGLIPAYWTRWHLDNWSNMDALIFLSIFYFPITILLIYAYFKSIYSALKGNEFDRSRLAFMVAAPVLFLIIYLLGAFPGSV